MSEKAGYLLGTIKRSRGLKGELLIALRSANIEFEKRIGIIWLGDNPGHLHPWDVEYLRQQENNALLKLKEINSREEADYLKNIKVYISEDEIHETIDNDLIGYQAYSDDDNRYIGKVTDIHRNEMQGRVVIENNTSELIVPLVDEFIKKVDHDKKQIRIFLLEGMES